LDDAQAGARSDANAQAAPDGAWVDALDDVQAAGLDGIWVGVPDDV